MYNDNVRAFEIAAVLLRSWLAKMRAPKLPLNKTLAGIGALLGVFSVLLVFLFALDFPFSVPELFGLTLVTVHMGAVFAAVLSSCAAAQESSVMAWWRAVPLSNRRLGCGLSIPVWVIAAAQVIVITPVLVVMFGQGSYANAVVLCCIAIGTGTILGRALMVGCKLLCRLISVQLANLSQAVAMVVWMLYCAACLYVMQRIMEPPMEGLSPWAVFGFPLLVFVLTVGSAWCWILIGIWVAALCVVEWCLWPRVGFEKYDGSTASTLGFRYRCRGWLPVFRLELVRLVRCSRAQVAVISSAIIQGTLMVACRVFGFGADSGFFVMMIFLNAMAAAYYPVIARGLSDRSCPYAMTMGLSPGKWALAVNLSAATVAIGTTVPFLIVWGMVSPEMPSLFIGVSLAVFALSVGGVVGFTLMPAADTGVVESVAVGIPFIVSAASISILQGFGLEEPEVFSPMLLMIGLALLAVPCLIERMRWEGPGLKKLKDFSLNGPNLRNAMNLFKSLVQKRIGAKKDAV